MAQEISSRTPPSRSCRGASVAGAPGGQIGMPCALRIDSLERPRRFWKAAGQHHCRNPRRRRRGRGPGPAGRAQTRPAVRAPRAGRGAGDASSPEPAITASAAASARSARCETSSVSSTARSRNAAVGGSPSRARARTAESSSSIRTPHLAPPRRGRDATPGGRGLLPDLLPRRSPHAPAAAHRGPKP